MNKNNIKVLFICLGNICRSPSAEGVFRQIVDKQSITNIEIDSAGTGNWHIGSPPDGRAQAAARERGIDLSGLRARQLQPEDGEIFDYLIAMDRENDRNIKSCIDTEHHHKVHMMLSFAKDTDLDEVPDPYYGGEDGFEHALDLIEQAGIGLLNHIRQNH